MNDKVLFVDDESNVLDSYRRSLRKILSVQTALSGQEALQIMETEGPFSVIVSDMQMPGMNGVEFLARARQQAPDTVRIMLTGNADQQTAIDAVNTGDVFRFLNKPCEPKVMAKALYAAVSQYRLITAEKELLEKTLTGSIGVLSDVLSMVNPEAFGKTNRIKRLVGSVAAQLQLDDIWQYETMASLSQVGCVILPEALLSKHAKGIEFNEEEKQLFDQQASVGADLLSKIPRLQEIANCVQYQGKNFDGSGVPFDSVSADEVPLGARILKIVLDFDTYQTRGLDTKECLAQIDANQNWYDPEVLQAFQTVINGETNTGTISVGIRNLKESMVLAEDVCTTAGLLVLSKGLEVSAFVIERLVMFSRSGMLPDKVLVYPPEPVEKEPDSK